MIDAARRAAEESLLDQALVRVDLETYTLFLEELDRSPASEGFERLMAASKPWENFINITNSSHHPHNLYL